MHTAIRVGAVLAAAATALPVTASTPAMADGYCRAGHVCMWEDAHYQGSRYIDVRAGGPYDIDWWNGDNEISSVDNASDLYIVMYDNDNTTGFLGCVAPHQRIPSLWRNDEMESFIARDFC
ncbi:peptidase inhibitor family I36 protein [Nocardiopsis suaedae]|uniref:Peptidase inhibitor family I36 protein n=1 Tax=Nocardiopsis suaedae TaxID=3018444 RepID=A0ABT4TN31_9ACTN|nr:peptidase inhibitor family I36 protein [Nocardiopsis suaedae]MDA2806111.1 peptidase inhibitor family I36 protein [Nocardiopsis suaedae]